MTCVCVQVYKQKVKHLLYQHQNDVAAIKVDSEAAIQQAETAHQGQMASLTEEREVLKQQLRQQVSAPHNQLPPIR